MTARAEISLYITCMHGVNTGLRGPAAIGHMVFFGPVRPTWYVFSIYLGSEALWWVMTAGVEISLYITCMHAGIIDSVGLSHFGHTRPVGRGHSQKKFFFLYISFMLGVETTLMDDDCARGDIVIYHVYAWC